MDKLTLNLIENAHSFATEALQKAICAEENDRDWKFAILHLVQAIELSLKELLRRQHPILIYRNVDKPKQTVSLHEALGRLRRLASLDLSKDETESLKIATEMRNNIVHHEFSAQPVQLKSAFAKLLGFLTDFHRDHLDDPLEDYIDRNLWQSGVAIRDYGEELFRRAKARMVADELDEDCMIACRKCGWDALTAFGDRQDTCYVCGHIEHLTVCERCQKVMLWGEHEELSGKDYCWDCFVYVTDDYWYEQSVGK